MLRRTISALVISLALGAVTALPAPARETDAATVGGVGIGDSYFPRDGNGGIDVQHYDVRDSYEFGSGFLRGRTTLRIRATQDLSRFNLDLLLEANEVRIDGRRVPFDTRFGHELRVMPKRRIASGDTFVVTVRYSGRPSGASYLGERNWLADRDEVVTMNQPHMAPWWFPANDHPRDKASMDVRITVPRGRQVISNGLPVGRKTRGRLVTSHWRSTEPMAPYLAFFAAGKFEVRKGRLDGRPWIVAVSEQLPGRTRRASMRMMLKSAPITAWLESQLGDYPFATTGGVVTSLNPGFALETQTRPTYPAVGGDSSTLLVHELAHQWFGDSVAVDRWRDIVLNEGFATFMEQRWTETHGGQSAAEWLETTYEFLRNNPDFWALRLDDPGPQRIFDYPIYVRGAMALQALRNRVGDPTFWTIMRTWASTHAGGNASVPDFVALAETLSGEELDGFFDAWWHATSRPARTAANGL